TFWAQHLGARNVFGRKVRVAVIRSNCANVCTEPILTDAARCPNDSNAQKAGFAKFGVRPNPDVSLELSCCGGFSKAAVHTRRFVHMVGMCATLIHPTFDLTERWV
ncbi:hypothetical protein, partial [Ruegeria sp. HKCCA5426]|uniref:hypothetical protein n=1 Tax=Ruegeria sp. HKCCA5426 TaxID=2682985 RepID=UPI001C2C720C